MNFTRKNNVSYTNNAFFALLVNLINIFPKYPFEKGNLVLLCRKNHNKVFFAPFLMTLNGIRAYALNGIEWQRNPKDCLMTGALPFSER